MKTENTVDSRVRGTERLIDRVWLILAAATAITWFAGDSGRSGMALVGFVFALAVVKGTLVALDFMELRHAPALWRRLVIGWLVVVAGLILFAYSIGQS